MKIKVTEEDIELGDSSGYTCPVARAMKRLGCGPIYVSPRSVDFHIEKKEYFIRLPEFVIANIALHDSGGKMQPFEFELDM